MRMRSSAAAAPVFLQERIKRDVSYDGGDHFPFRVSFPVLGDVL